VKKYSIFKNFCTASPNVMEPSPSTLPHRELSKDTKNTIWSILPTKQNKLPSFIDRCWCKFEEISKFDNVDKIFDLTNMEGNTLFLDWSLLANPTELNEDLSTFVQDSHLQTWTQFCSMRPDCNKHIFAQKIPMLSLMHFLCSFIQSFESKTHRILNLEEQTTYWHKQELVVW